MDITKSLLGGFLFSGEVNTNPLSLVNEVFFAALLGSLIYFIYYRSYTTLSYNKKFNISLVMITFAVTFMMLLVDDNIAVSFGMMGTLSIVRFRANVKDNRDIGFVLWALVNGLAVGTSNFVVGVIYSVIMSLYMTLTRNSKTSSKNYLLIIRGTNYTRDVDDYLAGYSQEVRLKAKNLTKDTFELVYDIKPGAYLKENRLTEALLSKPNVISANLLSSNSEIE
jgi:hypothetical protein